MNIAIITGASSGLGCACARQLDAENTKTHTLDEIWLVARREKRLATIAALLGTRARVFALDLTDTASIENIVAALSAAEQPEVRWLVNAAGFGRIGDFAALSATDATAMVDLDCRAPVLLTRAVLPFMGAGSHILNFASVAGFFPLPYLSLYAASKAFLLSWSRSLGRELRVQDVNVTAACPYWVRDTEFIGAAKKDAGALYRHFPFAEESETVVRRSLRAAKNGLAVVTPGTLPLLLRLAGKILPHSLLIRCAELAARI